MDSSSIKPSLRKKRHEQRTLPRTSVLWTGVICEPTGANAFDCTIRNINARGAEVGSKKALAIGDDVYLIVPRSGSAYRGSVVWAQDGRFGLSFRQNHQIGPTLPSDLKFLRYLLVQTKLRQMLSLVQRSVPLDDAARVIGWTDDEIEQLMDDTDTDQSIGLVVHRTKRLFEK